MTVLIPNYSDEDYETLRRVPSDLELRLSDWSVAQASAGDGGPPDNSTSEPPGWRDVRQREPEFRNREQELDNVVKGVTEDDGTRFWLVVAPPQLGKSWFLDRVGHDVGFHWIVRLCDVRALDAAPSSDAEALLRVLFASEARRDGPLDTGQIAGALLAERRKTLLLIDSAEQLDQAVVADLRLRLGEISGQIERAKNADTRLAVVVASRDDRPWLGIAPRAALRLTSLPLSEFKVGVVFAELRKLADELGTGYSNDEVWAYADLVHKFSEGLPALLRDYVNWLRSSYFARPEPASVQRYFDGLATPYIDNDLMSTSSLLGCGQDQADLGVRSALQQAIRVLSPYRLITRSHVSHYARAAALSSVLEQAGLSAEQVWQALSGVALLCRPNGEPWKVLHPPIRRLLYRHWHPSETERALAQAQACNFLKGFNDISGRDQVDFLIERLWHELQSLELSHSPGFADAAIGLAASLASTIRPSRAGEVADLREYLIAHFIADDEIMKVIARYDGLQERLVEAVRNPGLGAGS